MRTGYHEGPGPDEPEPQARADASVFGHAAHGCRDMSSYLLEIFYELTDVIGNS
jgi:hypothetical protein